MACYHSSFEAPDEHHSGSPHSCSKSAKGKSIKKLKRSILESPKLEMGGEMSRLPEDIVLDIFSRLSVKDLKNCIPVRKSWYQTVLSPNFAKLHHEKSAVRSAHMVSFIIQDIYATDEPTPHDFFLVESELSSDSAPDSYEVLRLRTKFKELNVECGLVGSCEGLLCLSEPPFGDPVYICNPLVGEYMTLPSTTDRTDIDIVAGFGYDPVAGRCKVIRLIYVFKKFVDEEILYNLEAEVYILGIKNWRKVGSVPYQPSGDNPGVVLDGFIYWLSDWELCKEEKCGIVCFDVASEQFSLIPLPPGYTKDDILSGIEDGRTYELSDIKGCLCFFDEKGDEMVVWVLKQHGINQSWYKEFALDALFSEFRILKDMPGLPSMYEECYHQASLISYRDAEEEPVRQEGYNKLETWSKNLCLIPSPSCQHVMHPSDSSLPESPLHFDEDAPVQPSDDSLLQDLRPYDQLYNFHEALANEHLGLPTNPEEDENHYYGPEQSSDGSLLQNLIPCNQLFVYHEELVNEHLGLPYEPIRASGDPGDDAAQPANPENDENHGAVPAAISDDANNGAVRHDITLAEFCIMMG